VLVSAAFFSKTSAEYSRVVLANWVLLAFSALTLERVALRGVLRLVRKSGHNTRSLAIAGIGKTAQKVAKQVEAAKGDMYSYSFWMGCYCIVPSVLDFVFKPRIKLSLRIIMPHVAFFFIY
ncbi:MAG: hypothetical protein ACK53Y_25130, partial [bacterium]